MKELLLTILIAALVMSASLIPLAKRKKRTRGVSIWRTIVLGILVLAAAAAMFYPSVAGK